MTSRGLINVGNITLLLVISIVIFPGVLGFVLANPLSLVFVGILLLLLRK